MKDCDWCAKQDVLPVKRELSPPPRALIRAFRGHQLRQSANQFSAPLDIHDGGSLERQREGDTERERETERWIEL